FPAFTNSRKRPTVTSYLSSQKLGSVALVPSHAVPVELRVNGPVGTGSVAQQSSVAGVPQLAGSVPLQLVACGASGPASAGFEASDASEASVAGVPVSDGADESLGADVSGVPESPTDGIDVSWPASTEGPLGLSLLLVQLAATAPEARRRSEE